MGKIIKAVTGIFAAPKMPEIKTPTMPDPGSAVAKVAARRKVEGRRKEGRAGTIYTSNSSGAYGSQNLGGTS